MGRLRTASRRATLCFVWILSLGVAIWFAIVNDRLAMIEFGRAVAVALIALFVLPLLTIGAVLLDRRPRMWTTASIEIEPPIQN